MIPIQLQIKNFLSYGPELQTIEFGAYPLICLSGKNGHGKSALLDAITWALWGQARKVSTAVKADQGLLRIGQTQMMVVLDFMLGDQLYRVRREFAFTNGKPYAQLEFGILNQDTDAIIPLTDKTIKATQQVIDTTLHINFDSFVNSAFLRQGNANEFSKKSPKDRKEILASILGLDQYEQIRKRAMEKIRAAQTEKAAQQSLHDALSAQLAHKTTVAAQLIAINELLKNLAEREQETAKQMGIQEQQKAEYAEQQKKRDLLIYREQQSKQQIDQATASFIELAQHWRTIHRKQRLLLDYKKKEQEKNELTQQITLMQKQLQEKLELKEQYLKIKELLHTIESTHHAQHATQQQAIQIDCERKKTELQHLQTKITELSKQQEELTEKEIAAQTELAQHSANLIARAAHEKELSRIEKQFEERKQAHQRFITQGTMFTSELNEIAQKELMVEDEENPSCPLCEQNVSASRRRFLKQRFAKKEQFVAHQRARLARVVKQLKIVLVAQHEQLQQLKKQSAEFAILQVQATELAKQELQLAQTKKLIAAQLTQLQQNSTQGNNDLQLLEKKLAKLADPTTLLATDSAYQKSKQELDFIVIKAKECAYDPLKHKQLQEQLQNVETQIQQTAQLQQEMAQQSERMASATKIAQQLRTLKNQRAQLEHSLLAFAPLAQQQTMLRAAEEQLLNQAKSIQHEKETALQHKGSLEAQHTKLAQVEMEIVTQQKNIARLNQVIEDYQIISLATGKDGVQALLIEDAIPEIEQEANNLLAKLTNNQAQIFIESLRDLKSGGTKETLDIKISDDTGIRPYELFSGGEAFRIDFALRIAVSKLLARRAGTALQTLIIDEGFGSQDDEGLSQIMDAIYRIQDDFAKIIVVSHLPSMKEQFPIHFMVEKQPTGSVVKIVELC